MRATSPKLGLVGVCLCAMVFPAAAQHPAGLPEDWSHRHLIFSHPGSAQQAMQDGSPQKWTAITSHPRFLQQAMRRSPELQQRRASATRLVSAEAVTAEGAETDSATDQDTPLTPSQKGHLSRPLRKPPQPHGDWSYFLGSVAGATVAQNNFPAKYSFDVNAAPSCTNDFVAFAINQAGGASQPSIIAFNQLYSGPAVAASASGTFTAQPTSGQTVTIINGGSAITLTASASSNTGTNFQTSGTTSVDATNLAAAIQRNGGSVGVGATSAGSVVSVTALALGFAGNNIQLQSTLTGFTWATGKLIGGTDAGICGSGAPSVMWAYNAGTTANLTSPVLSLDGTKIAFVETGTTGAILHVLKWKSGEGTASAPRTPTTSTSSSSTWTTCVGTTNSCMFNLQYTPNANTNSYPFYDYANDTAYIGDDNGVLWKVTGIFKGTPAPATGTWASGVTVHPGSVLTGPVYDSVSRNIFVADASGRLSYVRDTGSTVGTCAAGSPPCLGSTTQDVSAGSAQPVVDPPIVDSTTGKVFAFDMGGSSPQTAQVMQTDTALGNAVTATMLNGSSHNHTHAGAFDNSYFNGAPFTNAHLYACGRPANNYAPELFSIGFNSTGTMNSGAATAGPVLGGVGGNGQECSPLSEIYDTTTNTDWLFLGVTKTCGGTIGASGCIYAFDITSGPPAVAASVVAEPGGTSGMIVDNVSSSGQAQSLYFSTLGAATCGTSGGGNVSGCAVKRTQSGLQ